MSLDTDQSMTADAWHWEQVTSVQFRVERLELEANMFCSSYSAQLGSLLVSTSRFCVKLTRFLEVVDNSLYCVLSFVPLKLCGFYARPLLVYLRISMSFIPNTSVALLSFFPSLVTVSSSSAANIGNYPLGAW